MSLPASGYPRTAAITPRLHLVDSVDSTNAKLLRDAVEDPEAHPHLSVVLTRDQRAGRGRLDRSWTSPPGTAVALSVLLRVGAIPVSLRGWIPLVAGAAMAHTVAAQARGIDVGLKWPNDVLAGGRKISGILAEVVPGDPFAVVVGAGVNTAMARDQLPVPTATSFAVLDRPVDEDRLIADYLTRLRDGIAGLAVGDSIGRAVRDDVREVCLTPGHEVSVELPGGSSLTGTAVRIDDDGRLVVASGSRETIVAAGDVVHVR
ncbi:biotin--[acetyl-CoA-carboxylase] ligase [Microbacterium sp.]|uniref:biotin--[acetyl-CoA-carboxylase] ligase n=1 Tax=Microbacterium sp. TaxID=51671 RepID=UPI003A8ACE12